ncbi:MAG TPA: hypothetical protein VN969_24885 [Streptosporangiaceae bacterium]|jgi:hypothetical protein|nr:hypothetical protein [Streptosporangiaceae bacterium]
MSTVDWYPASLADSVNPGRYALAVGCGHRSMAEPSWELSVGDALLVVGRAGWTPVRGGLNVACAGGHGICSLPAPGEPPADPLRERASGGPLHRPG